MDTNLQEIKDKLDIVDVISHYIQVKKSGISFKASCPFHSEKSASLMVSQAKQIWHCFGCGEGGDMFSFVMRYENIPFKEALKVLADKAGVQLVEYKGKEGGQNDLKEQLIRINTFAARFYNKLLMSPPGRVALAYIESRGLNSKTIEQWQIGFAPNDFHSLEKMLQQKAVPGVQMIAAGVSVKNERGQMYDRFRNRITFPIFSFLGEIVGFSARTLESTDAAKYINSPETIIYNKSKVLFGLNFAKQAIRKSDEVVIVEGQMDCISAHQAGFVNTVATSGTALTHDQLLLLKRLTTNIKFCFDKDAAGRKALQKGAEAALEMGFSVKVVDFTGAKDPDELIQKDPKEWQRAVAEAVWLIDSLIETGQKQYDFNSVEQKRFIAQEVMPFVLLIKDPLEKSHYESKIVQNFNIAPTALRQVVSNKDREVISAEGVAGSSVQAAQIDTMLNLEKEVLGGLLMYGELRTKVKEIFDPEDFKSTEIRRLALLVLEDPNNTELQTAPLAKESMFMVEFEQQSHIGNLTAHERELYKSYKLLKLQRIKEHLKRLTIEIKRAEAAGDRSELMQLQTHFIELTQARLQLEQSN